MLETNIFKTNIVEIDRLNHYYREGGQRKQVLSDVNLAIQSGETLLLTGESGSGKTTLLSLIGCLRSLQEGSLKIFDRELFGIQETKLFKLRRHIGFIFQHFNLLDFMNIEQNVQISLELQADFSPGKARRMSREVLEKVGLGNKFHAYPRQLSGGQKQRVAIARALVHSPQLILADEPTAALDSKTGLEAIELIQNLAREQGSAVLIVTHDQRIFHVADRIIQLEDGRLKRGYSEEAALGLSELTERELHRLATNFNFKVRTYQPGEIIVREGDRSPEFYILIQGTVEVFQQLHNAHKVVLNRLERGDYFGEIAMLMGQRSPATVQVVSNTPVKILVINRKVFLDTVSDSGLTKAVLLQQMLKRLKISASLN
ncbi:ATP-binding cassette domain-containing protein [Spirulina sp. 06S082]|uniref:ATP-binding cassette domain-containing protein n=1 Tax=Spirulina sp. 06S082 TaxID=3110248 RepID=UPI002B2119D8|nr:ATP-binding cassette domain-containing protein [Spirulina sp. 06S082]MEA5470008.1 ATP-binding cassette domain-containing protein [Spirulina sp. 06S082]